MKKQPKLTNLDISELLDDEEMIAEYLSCIIEENDSALLLHAIGHIAKARGMAQIAENAGLGRESLYKALNENAHPRFDTVLRVLGAMNVKMSFAPMKKRPKKTAVKKSKKLAVTSIG